MIVVGWVGGLFQAAELERLDDFSTEENQKGDHRDDSQNGTSHQAGPIRDPRLLLGPEGVDGYRHHPDRLIASNQKRPEELVPGGDSGENGQGGQG